MKYYSRLIVAAFLIVIIGTPVIVFSAEPTQPGKGGSDKVQWFSFDKGMAKAMKENKNVLIDFYTDWCHWCKEMDKKTFSNTAVQKKLAARFVPIRINAESNTERANYKGQTYTNVELTRAFGVRGFPALAFLDKQGEPITVVPGFVPAETFVHILDYIDKECYKQQMSFEDFMKKKDECDKEGK